MDPPGTCWHDSRDMDGMGSERFGPLTEESQGACRLRLVGGGQQKDLPFADAQRARQWIGELMARSRCDL